MHGCEWVVEAYGCDSSALASRAKLQALFRTLIDNLLLHPVHEPQWHEFPAPGGITGMVMLAESHLACHTFPEYGSLCLNLFCCRPRAEWNFESYLRAEFAATRVAVRRIQRPYQDERESSQLPELRSANLLPVV
jgi:S-adenosylmethionine decarboxylase